MSIARSTIPRNSICGPALQLAPRQVGRVIALARKYLSAHGRNKESDALFDQAERIAPEDPRVIYERASAYVKGRTQLG